MPEDYQCSYCGKWFSYARKRDLHEESCGLKSLNEFTDQKETGTLNLDM